MLEQSAKIVPRAAFREALGDAASEIARMMPELRRLFDDVPPPMELPPEQQRRYLFNAFGEFIDRATRVTPIVAVLEDLHWGDEPTLLLMQHLAQQVATLPFLIVGTYRDVELDVTRPFARVLEGLLRERRAIRIPLRRLGQDEVGTLLTGLSGQPPPTELARIVYRETEGNPFFVEEVFQHLSEEGRLFDDAGRWRADLRVDDLQVPEGVRLVIGRRLERISDEARGALTVAAVIGRNFDLRVVEAATDIDGDKLLDLLEEVEQAQLISSAASGRAVRYIFAHELIRQTLVETLSLPRRQRLHARVAEAIEQVYRSAVEKQASQIAHHLYQAGLASDPEKTLRFLDLAATQAMAASGFEEALGHLDAALSMEEAPEGIARADLLAQRGDALRSLGRSEEAITEWHEALGRYQALGAVDRLPRLTRDLAFLLYYQARPAEALEVCERGLAAAGADETADTCRLRGTVGLHRAVNGDHPGGTALIDRSILTAEQWSDQRLLGEMLGNRTRVAYLHLDVDVGIEAGERALSMPEIAADGWHTAIVQSALLPLRLCGGRPAEVLREAPPLRNLAERLGHHGAWVVSDAGVAGATVMTTGRLDTFEAAARRGVEAWRRGGGIYVGHGPMWLGWAQFWQGQWEDALASFETAVDVCRSELVRGWHIGGLLWCKAHSGHEDVGQMWAGLGPTLATPGRPALLGALLPAILGVEALVTAGRRDQAHALYPLVVDCLSRGLVTPFMPGLLAQTMAGTAAAAGGVWAPAEAHFETALGQAHAMPDLIAQPEARRWYAWMLSERNGPGDHDRAHTLLGEAVEMYQRLGMPRHLDMAERMVKDL